ncbi:MULTISPECIES: fimbrial biogenesis chaperone [Atlantibacter]|uniref:Putative fimbrial chaperone protein n=1 Tax=Atlantibacter hermannii NBRC 105704 TaxID=1115512 RepID=H5V0J0_ATLHE|nr:putative fimbrial chaperone protein [Atlantibacter hermannii NBRC 105704]VDZ74279.1 periplasmic pilin chaperone (lpfB-like) [Atlantibacter hermannii]
MRRLQSMVCKMKLFKSPALLLSLLLCFTSFANAGGIVIGGTRVIYNGSAKEASINVQNNSTTSPFLLQSWVENSDEKGRAPFVVTPPLFRIEPQEKNTLRINKLNQTLPSDRESLFFLNIRAIPSSDKNAVNTLKLVVKSKIKLFYRPAGLSEGADTAWKQLRFTLSKHTLTVENPTPWHVVFSSLKVGTTLLKDAETLTPFSKKSFNFDAKESSHTVTWQVIDDFGGTSEPASRQL